MEEPLRICVPLEKEAGHRILACLRLRLPLGFLGVEVEAVGPGLQHSRRLDFVLADLEPAHGQIYQRLRGVVEL